MEPFYKEGDFVFVNGLSYWMSYPKVKDVVVLYHPAENHRLLLKRIMKTGKSKRGLVYWVEGINKEKSSDSRDFGWISKERIVGKGKVIHRVG